MPDPASSDAGIPLLRGSTLTIGFSAVLVMWGVLYVAMMPAIAASPLVAGAIIVICLITAGRAAARAGSGWRDGLRVGGLIGVVNLIILGSTLGGGRSAETLGQAAVWAIAMVVVSMVLGAAGGALGSPGSGAGPVAAGDSAGHWTARFALVAAAATFVLLIAGGVVTSLEAGLAVRGWLTSNDYPLILFPLHLMQSEEGVYAEHAHRLWGLLVGLTTIMLVLHLALACERRGPFRFALAILAVVIVQGLLGGTRVIERSLTFAVVHGILGQILFAAMAALAAYLWPAGRPATPAAGSASPALGRRARSFLHAALLVQLVLGAMYRHLSAPESNAPTGLVHGTLGLHVLGAVLVTVLAILVGARSGKSEHRAIRRCGRVLTALVVVQLVLGVAALVTVMMRRDAPEIPATEVALTTTHQASGALLLATATVLPILIRRRQ